MLILCILLLLALTPWQSESWFSHRVHSRVSVAIGSTRTIEMESGGDVSAPAMYADDLYAVLDVSRNASSREIKDAYWKLAVQYHPDKNDSPEALEIFRNASYAYQILGKDAKTRAMYDSKGDTQDFIRALSDIGSEVLVPLARDVAVPLVTITAQSIGNFAIPIFKNVFETSNAAMKAVFEEEDAEPRTGTGTETGTSLGSKKRLRTKTYPSSKKKSVSAATEEEEGPDIKRILQRASLAVEKSSMNQTERKRQKRIQNAEEKLLETNEKLIELQLQVTDMKVAIPLLDTKVTAASTSWTKAMNELKLAEEETRQTQDQAARSKARSNMKKDDIMRIEKRKSRVVLEMAKVMEEVTHLEKSLVDAKSRKDVLDQQVSLLSEEITTAETDLISINQNIAASELLESGSQARLVKCTAKAKEAEAVLERLSSERETKRADLQRKEDYMVIMKRKSDQFEKKLTSIKQQLDEERRATDENGGKRPRT
jgi:curved DNA-binding protein CbpA